MQFSALALALLPAVFATIIRIEVGNGGLVFNPNNVRALPGDILQFNYFPANHSVTQSDFQNPCKYLNAGVNSGFVPVANASAAATQATFNVQVNDTRPIWLFCAQGRHCSSGMSMVVNEPNNNRNTLVAYQAAARNTTVVAGPVAPVGGRFLNRAATESTSSAASSLPLTTYTQSYSTYTTSTNGAPTTVTLVETVTAIPSSLLTSSGSAPTGSASSVSRGAAPTMAVAGWVMAAGAAGMAGMLI